MTRRQGQVEDEGGRRLQDNEVSGRGSGAVGYARRMHTRKSRLGPWLVVKRMLERAVNGHAPSPAGAHSHQCRTLQVLEAAGEG